MSRGKDTLSSVEVDISKESDDEEGQEENKKLELLPYEIAVFVIVIIAGDRKKFYNRNGIITINNFLLQYEYGNSSST